MKKTLQLLVILFLTNSYSQVVFEKGYFIDMSNKKSNLKQKSNVSDNSDKYSESEILYSDSPTYCFAFGCIVPKF